MGIFLHFPYTPSLEPRLQNQLAAVGLLFALQALLLPADSPTRATDSPVSVSRHLGNKGKFGWVFAWLQADSNAAAGNIV